MRHFIPYKRTNYILFTYSIVLLVCLRANKRLMGPQNVLKALICILNYKVTKWTREFLYKPAHYDTLSCTPYNHYSIIRALVECERNKNEVKRPILTEPKGLALIYNLYYALYYRVSLA